MKDISIVNGVPFKAKVLHYSKSEVNKVVISHRLLYKVNGYVFLTEDSRNKYNDRNNDIFAFVLKVRDVYLEVVTYSRWMIEKFPNLLENAEQMARNYVEEMNNLIEEGKHIQLLHIRVFEELGLDTQLLWDARRTRELRIEKKRDEDLKQKQEQKLEVERSEDERLQRVKQEFLKDEYINIEDFLVLCKQAGIDIHIRTKGVFKKNVTSLKMTGSIKYSRIKGKEPNLDGCFKIIGQYRKFLNSNRS